MNALVQHRLASDDATVETGVDHLADSSPLRASVLRALDQYFRDLDGHTPHEVYRMVVGEVEQAMLESVMDYARGNQTHASEILGINRGTLRKKLRMYQLD